ncbi:hypothetical protein [Nonomuraea salmonea]|uniref:hypothetical protein n=1 Tax=Nonomuraea salmonea TaxID=46181 RepID=UPI002FEBBD06
MSTAHTTSDQAGAWTVMQRIYEAEAAYVAAGGFGKASYDDVAAYLDPEVTLHQAPGLPFTGSGTWRGHDGMERFLARFSAVWESMEFLEQEHWGGRGHRGRAEPGALSRPCHRPGGRHLDRAADHRQGRPHARMPPLLLGSGSDRRRLSAGHGCLSKGFTAARARETRSRVR